jgi:hypothetical protein
MAALKCNEGKLLITEKVAHRADQVMKMTLWP